MQTNESIAPESGWSQIWPSSISCHPGDLLSLLSLLSCQSLHCLPQNMMKHKPMREEWCVLESLSHLPLSWKFPAGHQDIFCLLSSPNQPGHSGGEQARPVSLLASKENRNMIHFSARIALP